MMKMVSKTFLAIATLIATLFLAFAASPAWAEGENIVTDPSTGMGVTHTMYTNAVTNDAGITYAVVFTPLSDDLDSGFSATGHATISPVTFAPATDTADTGSTEWTRNFTKQVTLPSASAFQHAGAWAYLVSEIPNGGASADSSKWYNSAATYKLRVYIENDDVNGGLKYGAWSVEELLDADGNTIASPEKVDATYPPASRSGLLFTSQYVKNQTISVTKEVQGSFADRTHEFPITTTLTLPDWYHDPTSANPAPAISYVDASGTSQSGVPTYSQSKGTWELAISDGYAHGNTLTATVPVGTRYAIDETNPNASGLSYTPSVSWNVGMPVDGLKLVYNANGGRGSIGATAADPVSHEAGVTSSEYVRDGYVQIGWNTEADHSGDYYFAGDNISLSEDTTLYAVWIPATLQIDYIGTVYNSSTDSLDLDTVVHSATVPANSLIDLDYDPAFDDDSTNDWNGFRISAWYDCDFIGEEMVAPMTAKELAIRYVQYADDTEWYGDGNDRAWNLSEPMKLYGEYVERWIPVTFVTGLPSGETVTQNVSWTSTPRLNRTWEAYEFTGWHTVDENGQVVTSSDTVGSLLATLYSGGYVSDPNSDGVSFTLYGTWRARTYSVTYDYGYDNLSETIVMGSGTEGFRAKIDRPGPEREGYTFLGWAPNNGDWIINSNTPYSMPVADDTVEHLTLVAQWSAN